MVNRCFISRKNGGATKHLLYLHGGAYAHQIIGDAVEDDRPPHRSTRCRCHSAALPSDPSHWLSELVKEVQSWGKGIHEWVVFRTMEHVWSKRTKLMAIFKKSQKESPAAPVYSVGLVQLPNPDRTASIGMSFSTPTSIKGFSSFQQTK
jgi:hypothetical protein